MKTIKIMIGLGEGHTCIALTLASSISIPKDKVDLCVSNGARVVVLVAGTYYLTF
jgi:hypothetical protein